MVLDNFKEKFNKLIKILTTDEKVAEEFSSIETVDESFDFACRLVGEMDRVRYHEAVKDYIENLDSDQDSVFDTSFRESSQFTGDISSTRTNPASDGLSHTVSKKSSPDYNSLSYEGKKISSSDDEKKISGGALFRHRRMRI